MEIITKVSDITIDAVQEYANLGDLDTSEQNLITSYIGIAKRYIKSYTGLDDEGMDEYQDLDNLDTLQDIIIVVFILCQDMWDNRSLYVDSTNINRVCQSILDLHSINLL